MAETMTNNEEVRIVHEGVEYVRRRGHWYDAKTGQSVPSAHAQILNGLAACQIDSDLERVTDLDALLERSYNEQKSGFLDRSERLARRALAIRPDSPRVVARLSSVLRALRRFSEAIALAAPFENSGHVPLLNSLAAALIDAGRHEDARRIVGRSLAIKQSDEAFSIVKRIKAERPDLYQPSRPTDLGDGNRSTTRDLERQTIRMRAKYNGNCQICRRRIAVGEWIHYHRETKIVIHEGCLHPRPVVYIGGSPRADGTLVFHKSTCGWVGHLAPEERVTFGSRNEAIESGYRPCGDCWP